MPELPEVETIRRQLSPRLVGRVVVDAGAHWSEKFSPAVEVMGARFTDAERRGKFLLIGTDDDRQLVIHLGMTGQLGIEAAPAQPPTDPDQQYLRAWWMLDDDCLFTYKDIRRFGRIRVIQRGDFHSIPALRMAGPEPWDPELDGRTFHSLLRRSRRPIKTQLLSQRPIAGVGNIYADEALWLAEISPRATRLSPARATRLLDALRTVLTAGIDNGGTTLRDYRNAEGGTGQHQRQLQAYGRRDEPCARCGDPLRSATIDARTTTWCGTCQRR